MRKLFDDQDSSGAEEEVKINVNYEKNYDSWRQKEELQKLKAKYGDKVNLDDKSDETTSSSEDDSDEELMSQETDKDFFKTLAYLKNKDPRIYDRNVKFFKNHEENEQAVDASKKKKKKGKTMNLREYNSKLIVEKEGKLSDSEDEDKEKHKHIKIPYVQQIATIQESIGKTLQEIDDNDDGDVIIKPKINNEREIKEEANDIVDFLKGKEIDINEEEKKDFEPLRNYWNNSNLDENEQFLRDYILNQKFLDKDNDNEKNNCIPDSDLNLIDDEKDINEQEEFEHKYNFRFEEPDQEFIKRYPRTLENSMRKKDTRRADKRAEIKKRKEEEKMQKREKLKELKVLKRKEIEERLEKLKEITGNDDIQLNMMDLEDDFDPDAYDKKMSQVFNDDYYAAARDEDVKPEFPEIDEILCIEPNWDNYDPQNEICPEEAPHYNEPHCEDPNFNMDADYDGTQNSQDKIIESTMSKKKRRRSKFAQLIAKEKPKFDPVQHSSYKEYYDQYYALDYEDMIGDIPCRFKYREVVPNNYGLTLEEILAADEKELNRWCSLKKALQYKPEHIELNDVKVYQEKAKNEFLKRKILKSLYKGSEEADETSGPSTSNSNEKHNLTKTNEKEKEKYKTKVQKYRIENTIHGKELQNSTKKLKKELQDSIVEVNNSLDTIVSNKETQQKSKKKRKRDSINSEIKTERSPETNTTSVKEQINSSKKFKKESTSSNLNTSNNKIQANSKKTDQDKNDSLSKKELRKQKYKQIKKKFDKKQRAQGELSCLSEERLKAYGLNPKKFKNKMKYMKKKL